MALAFSIFPYSPPSRPAAEPAEELLGGASSPHLPTLGSQSRSIHPAGRGGLGMTTGGGVSAGWWKSDAELAAVWGDFISKAGGDGLRRLAWKVSLIHKPRC